MKSCEGDSLSENGNVVVFTELIADRIVSNGFSSQLLALIMAENGHDIRQITGKMGYNVFYWCSRRHSFLAQNTILVLCFERIFA
jgi:hypothetical protein